MPPRNPLLAEAQQRQLSRLAVSRLLDYIDKGVALFPEDFTYVPDEKKQQIQNMLSSRPNPQEVKEWADLQPDMGSNTDSFRTRLEMYIARWEPVMPAQNHVADAKNEMARIDAARRGEAARKEQAEWDNVDMFDSAALIRYLAKYPGSIHRSDIDDALWALVASSATPVKSINDYLSYFPSGNHSHEAQRALQEYAAWKSIKSARNLTDVYTYIQDNPGSPFLSEARILLMELKEKEIDSMKRMASSYPVDTILEYLRTGLFSKDELIGNDLVTEASFEVLCNLDAVRDGLPNINDEINRCKHECAEGRTDVFLFGIPATGKSCILMGLIGSPAINVSYVKAGGPYAAAMQQYLDAGFTIGQTPSGFVATLEAEIPNGDRTHHINLVEMAGETFAYKLAQNDEGHVSFADMGDGAPALLSNDNRKAFFIIVDPTTRVVTFNRIMAHVDENGNEVKQMIRVNVNQRITLKRMVDLFALPENAPIMEKVDSIHIIVTKADTCGDNLADRDAKAHELFLNNYAQIIQPLKNLCERYGINVATGGCPRLYTFSLGNFYVGGIYTYDETDANKLVNVIKNNVWGMKKPSFFDKLRAIFNNPII